MTYGRVVRVVHRPGSLRCYVCGLRVHHGLTGVLLLALGLVTHRRGVFMAGALLVFEDWRDWPFPLVDR